MLATIRRTVVRGERAVVFVESDPVDGDGVKAMADRLEWLVDRAKELDRMQQEHDQARATAVSRKQTIRAHLTTGLLRLFANAGKSAGRAGPVLAEAFQPVRASGPELRFVTSARRLIDAARVHLTAVGKFGVEAGVIDEAAALLDEYETMATHASEALTKRVLACAELRPVGAEIMEVLGRLDGLHRHRFAQDPARRAAWKSALKDPGPLAGRRAEPATGDTGPTVPPSGGTAKSA